MTLLRNFRRKLPPVGVTPPIWRFSPLGGLFLSDQRLEELLRPTREAFRASGMTEDEAVELFEAEKHLMRQERKSNAS